MSLLLTGEDAGLGLTRTQSHVAPATTEVGREPEAFSLDVATEGSLSLKSLVAEIQQLEREFSEKGRGKEGEVGDVVIDVGYLGETMGYLDRLFGDGRKVGWEIRLPSIGIRNLKRITDPLLEDVKGLRSLLEEWPASPSVWSTVSFGVKHVGEVKTYRSKISEAQLKLTAFLSEATFLPEQSLDEPVSPTEPAPVLTINGPDGVVNNDVVVEHDEEKEAGAVWVQLGERLKELPCTLRLSHVNEQLGEVIRLAGEGNEGMKAFGRDVAGILELCKKLDGRLRDHHEEFAKDVMRELHTCIDLEVKMLLHELRLIPPLMVQGLFRPSMPLTYTSLPIGQFLLDHQAILMMIQCLVAGCRMSGKDPRHNDKTLKHEAFEEAGGAVLGRLAGHSGSVNSWSEVRRHFS